MTDLATGERASKRFPFSGINKQANGSSLTAYQMLSMCCPELLAYCTTIQYKVYRYTLMASVLLLSFRSKFQKQDAIGQSERCYNPGQDPREWRTDQTVFG